MFLTETALCIAVKQVFKVQLPQASIIVNASLTIPPMSKKLNCKITVDYIERYSKFCIYKNVKCEVCNFVQKHTDMEIKLRATSGY